MISLTSLALALLATAGGTEPLQIHCPPVAKLTCGASTDPSITGTPTVSGGCGGETVSYHDMTLNSLCPAARFDRVIHRTWTVTDACGNSVSCRQIIHLLRQVVSVDIKPTSCPNPFQLSNQGVFPVAILGSASFDVTTIDPSTVEVWTVGCRSGPVAPLMVNIEDVGTPFHGSGCDCHELGADGYPDLVVHFSHPAVRQILGPLPVNGFMRLVFTARTFDGCSVVGTDCIRIQ